MISDTVVRKFSMLFVEEYYKGLVEGTNNTREYYIFGTPPLLGFYVQVLNAQLLPHVMLVRSDNLYLATPSPAASSICQLDPFNSNTQSKKSDCTQGGKFLCAHE